jgi:hypothetical protein
MDPSALPITPLHAICSANDSAKFSGALSRDPQGILAQLWDGNTTVPGRSGVAIVAAVALDPTLRALLDVGGAGSGRRPLTRLGGNADHLPQQIAGAFPTRPRRRMPEEWRPHEVRIADDEAPAAAFPLKYWQDVRAIYCIGEHPFPCLTQKNVSSPPWPPLSRRVPCRYYEQGFRSCDGCRKVAVQRMHHISSRGGNGDIENGRHGCDASDRPE